MIGYPLLVVSENAGAMTGQEKPTATSIVLVLISCIVIGLLTTEGQRVADYLLFTSSTYQPGTAGGIYIFNSILSVVLGLMTIRWFQAQQPATEAPSLPEPATELTRIPVRKEETTILVPLQNITHFEAYDNYVLLYTLNGERHLGSYAIGQLQQRLPATFRRVHRKYLVNTEHITSVSPHLKGRFVLTLGPEEKQTIRSSASYAEEVRSLLKL